MLRKREIALFQKTKEKKELNHKLFKVKMQRRYLTLNVIDSVTAGKLSEAQKFVKLFKIIDKKCKEYTEARKNL